MKNIYIRSHSFLSNIILKANSSCRICEKADIYFSFLGIQPVLHLGRQFFYLFIRVLGRGYLFILILYN